mmetsp:Transcript_18323/g.55160  ORF Transcript_18323/g.55160 Transcript_18323/m.55160 type:complete len:120 (-) Transcript_18323:1009-1368(-)
MATTNTINHDLAGTNPNTNTDVHPQDKKEGLKDSKIGAIKEKVGSALHMHKTEQKGAAQHAKGEAQYSQEEGKGAAVGAKDKMVGAGKEVAGGLLGKEHLKNEGEAQQHAGTKRQEANQ